MSKKEMKAVVYPLTAEEFKQTEKITSQDVLDLINEADVEVESILTNEKGFGFHRAPFFIP